MVSSLCLMRRSASMPSMFGIITSSKTASGASDDRSAKPSAPPDASMISWPSQARFIPQSFRTSGSSSTTSTRISRRFPSSFFSEGVG